MPIMPCYRPYIRAYTLHLDISNIKCVKYWLSWLDRVKPDNIFEPLLVSRKENKKSTENKTHILPKVKVSAVTFMNDMLNKKSMVFMFLIFLQSRQRIINAVDFYYSYISFALYFEIWIRSIGEAISKR